VKMFNADKSRMIGLPYGEDYDDMLSRFHLIPKRYGRTDRQTEGQTDGQICYINMLTRDKNRMVRFRHSTNSLCFSSARRR